MTAIILTSILKRHLFVAVLQYLICMVHQKINYVPIEVFFIIPGYISLTTVYCYGASSLAGHSYSS